MASLGRLLAALCCFLCASGAGGLQTLPCAPQRQLLASYEGLRVQLTHFTDLYGEYAQARPKVVAEHVKAFQLHAVAQDFLEVTDAFRLLVCLALCPNACADPLAENGPVGSMASVRLVEKLNNLQLDLELVSSDDSFNFRTPSQQLLREAKQYAVSLVATATEGGGMGVDWDEALDLCVARVVSRIMFPLMKVVSLSAKQNESHTITNGVSLDPDNPAAFSASYISPVCLPRGGLQHSIAAKQGERAQFPCAGEVSFSMLHSLSSGAHSLKLSLEPANAPPGLCDPGRSPHLLSSLYPAWPRRWRGHARGTAPVPRVLQMLQHIEASIFELSHVYLALRPVGGGAWSNTSCEGVGLDYDPTLCLDPLGWGGHLYQINVHPPFRAELHILGRSLGDSTQDGQSTFLDVLHPYAHQEKMATVSLEHLYYRIDFLWRQANEPSPDVFFVHPAVHNCYAMEYLFSGAPIKPKILVVPINPAIPPPFEVMPRYEVWLHLARGSMLESPRLQDWVDYGEDGEGEGGGRRPEDFTDGTVEDFLLPNFWMAQCSLAQVDQVLKGMASKRFRYVLHHVEGAFAVYARDDLQRKLSSKSPEAAPSTALGKWLEGWFCRPESRFFANLEVVGGPGLMELADPSVPDKAKEATLCRLLDAHRIPVQRRNFDCAGVAPRPVSGKALSAGAGQGSCLRPDLRGWGNEAIVSDSREESAAACEARCTRANCSYWTYDPTSMYGQPLCWIWIGGRPAEIKAEKGWISGDVECHQAEVEAPAAAEPRTPEPSAKQSGPGDEPQKFSQEQRRQWAVQQLPELPGSSFFLQAGSRGRCVHGFCECFPPYRGPLCEQTDPGAFDHMRNFTAVLHYLTSDEDQDIEDIQHSLHRLWLQYNQRFDYPVVIFNDGLSEEHRKKIVHASDNRIWFAYVDDYLDVPDMITKDPTRKAMLDEVKWSLGYRGMCRFRSGTIFMQPVMANFEYAMTLDTDGYFPAEVAADPIAEMHAGSYVYTFSHLLPDLPGAVKHFWEYSLMYMRMKGIHPRGTPILRQFVREDDLQWTYQLYMNDIEIVQLPWFRSDPYQDYFRYLDSIGGFWLHRWGDHAVRTIAVGMWLPESRVYEMDIPYGHQNYCRCSGAHADLRCMREGDHGGTPPKWWICKPAGGED